MRLNREKLLSLWNLEDMPACKAGMQLVEAFLVNCGEAVDRFGEEGPEDRLAQITESYTLLVDHGNLCDDCNEAEVQQSEGVNDRPEEDKLPPVEVGRSRRRLQYRDRSLYRRDDSLRRTPSYRSQAECLEPRSKNCTEGARTC